MIMEIYTLEVVWGRVAPRKAIQRAAHDQEIGKTVVLTFVGVIIHSGVGVEIGHTCVGGSRSVEQQGKEDSEFHRYLSVYRTISTESE